MCCCDRTIYVSSASNRTNCVRNPNLLRMENAAFLRSTSYQCDISSRTQEVTHAKFDSTRCNRAVRFVHRVRRFWRSHRNDTFDPSFGGTRYRRPLGRFTRRTATRRNPGCTERRRGAGRSLDEERLRVDCRGDAKAANAAARLGHSSGDAKQHVQFRGEQSVEQGAPLTRGAELECDPEADFEPGVPFPVLHALAEDFEPSVAVRRASAEGERKSRPDSGISKHSAGLHAR